MGHQASIASRSVVGAAERPKLQIDVLCTGGDQLLMDHILTADAGIVDFLWRV